MLFDFSLRESLCWGGLKDHRLLNVVERPNHAILWRGLAEILHDSLRDEESVP